jgi:hypothetical protein
MKHDKKRSFTLVSLLTLGVLAQAVGCSDDDNESPAPVIPVDEGGSGGTGTTGGKSSSTAGKNAADGGTGAVTDGGTGAITDGGTGATGATGDGGDGPIEPPACTLPELGADGCFNCPKDNEPEQWLNRCVPGSKCVPFDNGRVKLLNADGSLPPFEP